MENSSTLVYEKTNNPRGEGERTLLVLANIQQNEFMGPGDAADDIGKVDAAISVVKGCFQLGMVLAPPPASLAFGAIAEFGSLIQSGLTLIPKNDKVMEKIKELQNEVKKLEDKTKGQFGDLKKFISEHHYAVGIITELSTLKRYLYDALEEPSEESIENFKTEYLKNTPINMFYTLISLLEHRFTNPLRVALDEEKIKTKTTFEKWRNIFRDTLGEFVLIEAFSSLFQKEEKCKYNCQLMEAQWRKHYHDMETLEYDYGKVNDTYWSDMKAFMDKYITRKNNKPNNVKAEEIQSKLDSYLTNDSFFVIVCDALSWQHNCTYRCTNESEQIISVWQDGVYHVIIYRSLHAHSKTEKDLVVITDEVKTCQNVLTDDKSNLNEMIQHQLLDKKLLSSSYGFICLLEKRKNDKIISTGKHKPGVSHIVSMKKNAEHHDYHLIVAYI